MNRLNYRMKIEYSCLYKTESPLNWHSKGRFSTFGLKDKINWVKIEQFGCFALVGHKG